MSESVCKSCGAPIRWTLTELGKRMPLSLRTEQRRFVVDTLPDGSDVCRSVLTYQSHFSDCPNAAAHRSAA